ncbi:hypothetical protein BKA59DRAFT_447956 [Fusarium tricinctum]|uniref:Uncharacterized protein n=1 Tax=Fusarium tricinctum TaxID=61284 RepID=A0A8K0SB84_9HYPO|nr:hypothetical protein BKA59DRAFT_447956 [Fusarium tricinctum]
MDQFEASRPDGPTTTNQPLLETQEQISLTTVSLASELEKPIEGLNKNDEVRGGLFSFLSDWTLETLALVLSLLSFIAMTYLLFASDEQPISKWTKSPITLNALVSILAGTSKSSLAFVISMCFSQGKWSWLSRTARPLVDFDRFDAASRGATGSLRVLKSCVRQPHWSALGALTAIALLAFEPFTQAILSLENRQVPLKPEEYAAMARANNQSSISVPVIGSSTRLDAGSWIGFGGGENSLAMVELPGRDNTTLRIAVDLFTNNIQDDLGMTAAVWSGFSPLITPQNLKPAFNCASGNCSWTNFASIAVCHKCEDISQSLVKTSGRTTVPEIYMPARWGNGKLPDISNQGPGANVNINQKTLIYTKYQVQGTNLSVSNYNGKTKCTSENDNCPDTYLTTRVTTNPAHTINFGHLNTMIMTLQYLVADKSWHENKTTWEETKVRGQECALSFCVNEYQDTLSQGVLQETVVMSWADRTAGSYSDGDGRSNMTKFFESANYTLDMGTSLVNLSDLQIRIPDEYFRKSNLSVQTFNITQPTIVSLLGDLNKGFWGPDLRETYLYRTPATWIYPSLGNTNPPSFVAGLGKSKHIPTTIENIALSLTKWMRDRDLETSPEKGSATAMVVITRVRWYFFLFPAISLLAGMIFSIICIWETQSLGRPALKDSILVTLACAPEEHMRIELKKAAATGSLDALGKEVLVVWHKDEGLGQLRQKEDLSGL